MAKFKKRAPSAPKKSYSDSRKKDRRAKRIKRINTQKLAEERLKETLARINQVSVEEITERMMRNAARERKNEHRKAQEARKRKQDLSKAFADAQAELLEIEDEKRELTQVEKLNAALDYASDKFGNRNDYAINLLPIIGEMTSEEFMDNLMKNPTAYIGDYEHFTISDDFDGNLNNLFKYITFKDIPPEVDDRYVSNILGLDWSTPEAYNNHVQEINHKIYESNLSGQGLDISTPYYVMLESVMQSSAAWHIAQKSAYDSEQSKSNWLDLYTAGMEASDLSNSNPEIWDDFVKMITNEESLDVIIKEVDKAITAAMKG